MTGLSARRLVTACAVSAASAVAFIAPAAASAACTGANIKGQGSSLQAFAQQKIWSPAFNEKCKETLTEQVEYASVGSGPGLESWGVGKIKHEFGAKNAYVGTDQPPNPTQKKEIEEFAKSKVLSIPTLQAAVAIPIHLPKGCTATSKNKASKGRLVLLNATLEKIFRHAITKWSEIKDDGDTLVGAECEKEAPIVRVVRKEGSGTTAITKKYLFQINHEKVDGEKTWNNLAEENKNLTWPEEEEANLERAEKGSGIAAKVAELPGRIGYANLNEVRANAAFTPAGGGGEGKATFWPDLQNNGIGTEKFTFADPSTNKEENAAANANCKEEVYVNGVGAKFPPKNVEETWNEVSAATKQKSGKYPLCGFTYDLALTHYGESGEGTKEEVETVSNYFNFDLSAGEQSALEGKDFLGLPTSLKATQNVLKIAEEGAKKIGL